MTIRGRAVLPASAPRDRWLAARRHGITATDVVKILGLSNYGNALDVYLDKRRGEDDTATSESAQWGRDLEDVVARRWAADHGKRVRRVGLMQHPLHGHHLASLDRVVVGEGAPLECKTRNLFAADLAESVPDRIAVQVQWQMYVQGSSDAYVAALIGGQQLVTHYVQRDDDVIGYLRTEADRVWAAVEDGEPPEVPAWQATAASLRRLHPERDGSIEVADAAKARVLMAEYRSFSELESAAKSDKEQIKLQLIAMLDGAEEATVDGRTAWTYRYGAETVTIPADHQRRLLADHPELADEYAVIKPGRATFNLKKES